MNKEEWLSSASQQHAILVSIRKPMLFRDIHAAAIALNPHIRLRDIGKLTKQLMARGYVRCINKQPVTGSIYYLTPKGRHELLKHAKLNRPGCPRNINWNTYARISRGRTRRAVFQELRRLQNKTIEPQTINRLRRELINHHPITLNATIRAMDELLKLRVVDCIGRTKKAGLRQFIITKTGENIGEVLDM